MTDLDNLRADSENLRSILKQDSIGEVARGIYAMLLVDVEQQIREAKTLESYRG
jgi:hypothetical protein